MKLYLLLPVFFGAILSSCSSEQTEPEAEISDVKSLEQILEIKLSKSLNEREFIRAATTKNAVIYDEVSTPSILNCAETVSKQSAYYVRSISLQNFGNNRPAKVSVGFDDNGKYLCFDVFQSKAK